MTSYALGAARPRRRRAWPLLAAVAATLAALLAAAGYLILKEGPGARFVEYAMLQPRDMPTAIAAAPDGTVWFTIDLADAIGRVRDGRLERLPKPGRNVEPLGLGAAPDGGVWYTDAAAGLVARMAPTGEVTSYRLDTPLVRLGRLAVAPDGAAWFAEGTAYSITSVKDGRLTRHVFDSLRGGPYGVAVAGDGTVWATLQEANQLLRIAPDGAGTTAFDLPRRGSVPTDVAVGPDGAVWFLEFRGNRVGRLKDGRFDAFEIGRENAGLSGLAVAPDGAVWFGMLRLGALGRLRDGEVEMFRLPRERARPYSLAADRDGNIWYADIAGFVGVVPARHARE
jgi:virginiamycin B lyase